MNLLGAINPWVLLTIAIVGELAGTTFLKLANGFEKPWAWLGVLIGFGTAFALLAAVIQKMDISVVYAIWSGVGIALVAVVGVVVFREDMNLVKAAGLLAIIIGIVLLQLQIKK